MFAESATQVIGKNEKVKETESLGDEMQLEDRNVCVYFTNSQTNDQMLDKETIET